MAVKTLQQLKSDLLQLIRTGGADTSAAEVRTMFTNVLDTMFDKFSSIKKIFLNGVLQTPDADGNLNLEVTVDTSNLATKQELTAAKDSIVAGSPDDTLLKLYNKIVALQALINGDDVNLDSIKEISDYIKANKALIDSITTDKVSTSAIYNALDLTTSGKVLDARQGKVLKDLIDAINAALPKKADLDPATGKLLLSQVPDGIGGSSTTEVVFAAALKFDKNYKTTRTAVAADALTLDNANAAYHNRHTIYYTAGSVKPTFGSSFVIVWDNWKQDATGGNVVTCVYAPGGKIMVDIRYY